MVRTIHHTASARGFWPLFGDTRYTRRVIIKKITIFSPQTYFYIVYWDGILDVGSAVGSTPTVVLTDVPVEPQKIHLYFCDDVDISDPMTKTKVCFERILTNSREYGVFSQKKKIKNQNVIFRQQCTVC